MMRLSPPPIMGSTGVARKTSEILKITDKITQALHDFDAMYDPHAEDEMISDLNSQIECLESGPLKYQLNEFLMKYKDMSTRSDERRTERNEILESVMMWFNASTFSTDFAEATSEVMLEEKELEESNAVLKEELLNTKVTFDKLQKLNSEMVGMAEKGLDVSHLERESKTLRQHAIMNFKAYKNVLVDVKQQKEMIQVSQVAEIKDTNINQVWKHAAGEICGMLSKVRDEGGEYILDLERKVRKLTTDIQDKAYLFEKMERQLKEFQALEQKWKSDNMKLMDEKALVQKKIGTYRKELKKTYKTLTKYERVKVPKFLEADEADEKKEEAPLIFAKAEEAARRKKEKQAQPIPPGGLNDPAILRAQLKNCKNEVEQVKQENEELQKELENMKEAFDDMEDECLRLERDKAELLHQMKKNSVRPDVRKLSSAAPPIPHRSSRTLSGSLTIVQIKSTDSSDKISGKKCCKCGLRVESKVGPLTDVPSGVPLAEPKVTSPETDSQTKEVLTDEEPLKQQEPPKLIETKSHVMSIEIKRKEEEVQSLSDLCDKLTQQLQDMEEELGKSHEIINLRQKQIDNLERQVKQAQETKEEAQAKLEEFIKKLQQSNLLSPIQAVTITEKSQGTTESSGEDMAPAVLRTRHKLLTDAHIISNKSVQTDPKLDPLGPWSKNNYGNDGWQPPKPPDKWVDFDPSKNEEEVEEAKKEDEHDPLRQAMLAGAEPNDIKEQTQECTNMIQRELQRMSHGIEGFVEYTNTLVDRETRIMANANRELKSQLTPQEIYDIDQELGRVGSGLTLIKTQSGHEKESLVKRLIKGGGGKALGISPDSPGLPGGLNIEEHVKKEITRIGLRSVDALKKLFRFINGTLKDQQEEYEHIYTKMKKKHPGNRRVRISDDVTDDLAPAAKRSKSHSDIHIMEDEEGFRTSAKSANATDVLRSKSQAWLTSETGKLLFPDHGSTMQVNEISQTTPAVGKATITKKGQILLTTTPIQQTEFGATFKIQDPVFRKIKPIPISHSKLKKKQQELLSRKDLKGPVLIGRSTKTQTGKKAVTKGVLTAFELPADFYSEYTVGEIEKTATQIVDQQKQHHHEDILEKVHLPFVNEIISTKQTPAGKTSPEEKFLPLL